MALEISSGCKQGLIIQGGNDEVQIIKKFSNFFFISFSKTAVFKNTNYHFTFLKTGGETKRKFNLSNELLLLFSQHGTFDTRSLDFVDKTLFEYNNRIDKICVILVSRDKDIERIIKKLNADNKESKIIVPFTYEEILNGIFSINDLENKFRKYFYSRDLFAVESPLKSENYFFGRQLTVQSLFDKYSLGEHAGLFGLRKIGKTSVLYGLERMIEIREGVSIYLDCQDTAVHKNTWFELLQNIISSLALKYRLSIEQEQYSDKTASSFFERDLQNIKCKCGNKRVLIILDEIEHISFKTSSSNHWKEGMDYIYFWQTLRAIYQRNNDLFCFLLAGVNPICIEQPIINGYDNPIFSLINPTYLDLFSVDNVTEMLKSIGSYMGLFFQPEVYTNLTDDYGGHPFLIRHICSLINSDSIGNRPYMVTKFQYKEKKPDYDRKIQSYIQLIISVLKNWYPEEYNLLEILVNSGNIHFLDSIRGMGNVIDHLIGYGIVKEERGNFYITINAIYEYIKTNTNQNIAIASTKESKWAIVSVRRNKLEEKLRNIITAAYKIKFGRDIKAEMLKCISENRKTEANLHYLELNTLIRDFLLFSDLKALILRNWDLFEKLFNDKSMLITYLDFINQNRIDAHSKDIDEDNFAVLNIAFNWFDKKLDNL